ncbi:N-6 DNA methylase [Actinomadura mexicana]|uniref:N-6 DNA Methylase n=1 Tax=Actinomadura mexicana TaxID=134959 RepID=A0A238Y651_9ACTN|nr:N-6 DNA methylase [Actinomadura mexicana]SNR66452.1 N-6 DNA Methylase [Actinomadura mexicana]
MGDGSLVSGAEIARLAGVERSAVSNWRRRHRDFPAPAGGSSVKPLFALAEVETWLRDRGKLRAIPATDRLWQRLRSYGDDRRLVDTLADVAVLLAFVGDTRSAWEDLAVLPDEELAERLPEAVASFVTQGRIPGGSPFADGLRPDQVPTWRLLVEMAREGIPEQIFEDLHSRYVDSTDRAIVVTPLDLATVIAAMVPPVLDGAVFDPSCGTGNLLQALGKKLGIGGSRAGQERDPAVARIAWYRIQWCGVGPEIIRQGDSLRNDQFAGTPGGPDGAAVVVCDPPTGDREWGHDELGYDARWEFGLPPRAEPELAWLQHCYAHIRPGGIAIVAMPIAAAARRSGRRIRGEMLRRGALREVIALPPGLAGGHSLGLHLWVLIRPSTGYIDDDGEISGAIGPATCVRMIDGSRFDRERVREIEGDWWHQYEDEPGVSAKVPVIELLDDDVDLTPARYVQRDEDDLVRAHEEAVNELTPVLGCLSKQQPPRMSRADVPADWPMVSLSELVKAQALDVILNRELPRMRIDLEVGDILVPVLDPSERPVVVRKESTLGLDGPTPDRHLIRCDQTVLDPDFVAGFLHSEQNVRQAVTGTGTFRFDPRRAMIPRLPLAEQRRYGAEFRKLAEFADLLQRTVRVGQDVVRLAQDGLTSGAFVPAPHQEPKGM